MKTFLLAALLTSLSSLAANQGEYCASTPLASGGSVKICRGLLSTTYSLGGNIIRVTYVVDADFDCQSEQNVYSPSLWIRAGQGEALLSFVPSGDEREVPARLEKVYKRDGSGCEVHLRADFLDHSAMHEPDTRLREINRRMMLDTNAEFEFAALLNDKWDSKFGENYRVWVPQYR
jgi:hypothetical protein